MDITNVIMEYIDDFERIGEDNIGKFITCGNCYNKIYYRLKRNKYEISKGYYRANIYVEYGDDFDIEMDDDIIYPIYEIEKDIVCSIKCKQEKEINMVILYENQGNNRISSEKLTIIDTNDNYTLIIYKGEVKDKIETTIDFNDNNERYKKFKLKESYSDEHKTRYDVKERLNKTIFDKKIYDMSKRKKSDISHNILNGKLILLFDTIEMINNLEKEDYKKDKSFTENRIGRNINTIKFFN